MHLIPLNQRIVVCESNSPNMLGRFPPNRRKGNQVHSPNLFLDFLAEQLLPYLSLYFFSYGNGGRQLTS